MSEADDSTDTEIADLLDFAPVPRKSERRDGWTAERQRAFIAILAATGDREGAAHAVGLTGRGAYELRKCAGAGPFCDAWDDALALYRRRNAPPPPPKARKEARNGRRTEASSPPAAPEADPEAEKRERERVLKAWLDQYLICLQQEREARTSGRVIAADYYARQLAWLEVLLSVEGDERHIVGLHALLEGTGQRPYSVTATPVSVLLDKVRRRFWAETDGLERPPLPELGYHTDTHAYGLPSECQYGGHLEGDMDTKVARRRVEQAVLAEAQALWEEKSRADSAAWRARIEAAGGWPDKVTPMGKAKPEAGSILDDL